MGAYLIYNNIYFYLILIYSWIHRRPISGNGQFPKLDVTYTYNILMKIRLTAVKSADERLKDIGI
jgi:hypothetical protein